MSSSQTCEAILRWLNQELEPDRFTDYCPNGLQVQGRPIIEKIVTGVTASQALIEHAIALNADAILVHHGWFWKNDDPRVVGFRKNRLARLLGHDINLIAYHLPLDAHPRLGNNAQLALKLGLVPEWVDQAPRTTGSQGLIWLGHAQPAVHPTNRLDQFVRYTAQVLKREPVVIGQPDAPLGRIAWCTGGAQSMFEAAINAGAQTFITGEISEPCAHLARENAVNFISAGHHATERYGIEALGQALAAQMGIEVIFMDLDNPA